MNKNLLKDYHLVFKNFISRDVLDPLYKDLIFCAKVEEKYNEDPEICGPAYNYYQSRAGQEMLCYLTARISDIAEVPLFPTYSWVRNYQKGSHLPRHDDKPSCEVSVTIHVGSDKKWDFGIVDSDNNEHLVNLDPGDAVVYLGCVAPHWRVGKYEGENYCQAFLHYVRSRGPLSYRTFDINNFTPAEGWKEDLKKEYKEVLQNNDK